MRILRRIYRVIALFLWGSWHGIYCLPIRYLYEKDQSIRRMALQTKYWGGGIVRILGIRTIVHGDPSEYQKTGGPNKINFLNKKRKAEKTIKINPTKVLIKTLFKTDEKIKVKNQKTSLFQVIKKSSYKKRKKYLKRIEKNIKTNCSHFGCETIFRTKKQALFHHYKMSR